MNSDFDQNKIGLIKVDIKSDADIVTARHEARELAKDVGFSSSELAVIAAAISELARNIVSYATEGSISFGLLNEGSKNGIVIIAKDKGPGIADIQLAMQDGYSTSNSLGLGLPGVKRLMDRFDISSEPGKGTTITVTKWVFK